MRTLFLSLLLCLSSCTTVENISANAVAVPVETYFLVDRTHEPVRTVLNLVVVTPLLIVSGPFVLTGLWAQDIRLNHFE